MLELLIWMSFGSWMEALPEPVPTETPEVVEESTPLLTKETLATLKGEDLFWVVAVIDGDTIMVTDASGELFQVRLLAVDTNEINGPDSSAECYGAEAALFTMDFLKDRAVILQADPSNEDQDSFGRKLRYVFRLTASGDLLSLNEALLSEGLASFPEEYPVTQPEHFRSLQREAQAESKGLWGMCEG